MTVHPIVRYAANTLGAIGGAALGDALLGTTTVVTTSYLMAILCFLVYVLALALSVYLGYKATNAVCNYVSDDACTGYGHKVGSAINSVRGLFSRKATA